VVAVKSRLEAKMMIENGIAWVGGATFPVRVYVVAE